MGVSVHFYIDITIGERKMGVVVYGELERGSSGSRFEPPEPANFRITSVEPHHTEDVDYFNEHYSLRKILERDRDRIEECAINS